MDYQVELPVYQGPFDLLIDLIKREKVSIWDIPISTITDQYIASLARMEQLDLGVAAEFLVMAATLLQMKAQSLLPRPPSDESQGEGPDPREELSRRLAEYSAYKGAAERMALLEEAAGQRHFRPQRPWQGPICYLQPVGETTAEDLAQLAGQLLHDLRERERVREVVRVSIDLPARMQEIIAELKRLGRLPFRQLLRRSTRREQVTTLMALLELSKDGEVILNQGEPYRTILISLAIPGIVGDGDESKNAN
ncbi:MAG: segregation and condensation protein A [Limnochordia bacterium]|jgi:segregation and condensation protein A